MKILSRLLPCILLVALTLSVNLAFAQSVPKNYSTNNAHQVLYFLLIQDNDIKTISARRGETLTNSLYGYDLDSLNAQKISFYRNKMVHKMSAPEDQFLSGSLVDSRFGLVNLSDLNVHSIVLGKKGDILSLRAHVDNTLTGQVGPYDFNTMDTTRIVFNPDGTVFLAE